ncbi:Hypotetical protein [Gulosibacter molinativorax]|nr:Hypotetical protein [Gulosibacter molinativorax]
MTELELTDAEWREFQAIPEQGFSHRDWVNARIRDRAARQHADESDTLKVAGKRIAELEAKLAGVRKHCVERIQDYPDDPFDYAFQECKRILAILDGGS